MQGHDISLSKGCHPSRDSIDGSIAFNPQLKLRATACHPPAGGFGILLESSLLNFLAIIIHNEVFNSMTGFIGGKE